MPRLTVVGDAFLDVDWTGRVDRVCPDAPAPVLDATGERTRPGGAGLAALYAADATFAGVAAADAPVAPVADPVEVTLVAALGADAEGDRVRRALRDAGVRVVDLGLDGPTPVKLRLRAGGRSLARVDRHCEPVAGIGAWTAAAEDAVRSADAVLVSDYGRGMSARPALSAALAHRCRAGGAVVWDPHPRGAAPLPGCTLVTPNLAEARHLAVTVPAAATRTAATRPSPSPRLLPGGEGTAVAAATGLAEALADRCDGAVAVTVGEQGAVLAGVGSAPLVVPARPADGDVCGAGDRFAATAAAWLAAGATVADAVAAAVEAGRRHVAGALPTHGPTPSPVSSSSSSAPSPSAPSLPGLGSAPRPGPEVAAGDGDPHAPEPDPDDPLALVAAVRSRGGTVVAAGGCFDVVHAGHVRLLEAARALGDCLVVCVNDDASVRRLKGDPRPLNPLADRLAVLRGLACVDAVVAFAEDTPCELLALLRPHLFVKGADHAGGHLPERQVLARWGGRAVLLPVLQGRSTTRILRAAAAAS
ncbi:MAG TPA: PfkB family carbohydrate kinase [Acidimicrobiales bacterium]